MKKILIAAIALLPMVSYAQSEWELPTQKQQQEEVKVAENKKIAETYKPDLSPYLAGAVPEVDGKIVFTRDIDLSGMTAQQIYDGAYQYLDTLTQGSRQKPNGESHIALVNKKEHSIIAVCSEWMEFKHNVITLDRSEFRYVMIVNCKDGHLNATVGRINYLYDEGRATELKITAEDWISDRNALNKKKNKLVKLSAKFRIGTIERVKQIFGDLEKALKKA